MPIRRRANFIRPGAAIRPKQAGIPEASVVRARSARRPEQHNDTIEAAQKSLWQRGQNWILHGIPRSLSEGLVTKDQEPFQGR
jgi:hypothetical protein